MVSGLHVSVDVRHRLYKDLDDFQQLTLLVYDLSILSILHDTHSVGKENILISILKIWPRNTPWRENVNQKENMKTNEVKLAFIGYMVYVFVALKKAHYVT